MSPNPVVVFRASSPAELGQPLQLAFEEALRVNSDGLTFRLQLAPGRFDNVHLALHDNANKRSETVLIVEGDDGDPARFEGGTVNLMAGRVLIRNLRVTAANSEGPILRVTVAHQFLAQDLAFVENVRAGDDLSEPLVALSVGYGSRTARAVWKRCWFVDNRVETAGPLIETPKIGRGTFESFSFQDSVFANNDADGLFVPWFTESITFDRCLAHEPKLTGAAFTVRSPLPAISLNASVFELKASLSAHIAGPDVSPDAFTPISVQGGALRLKHTSESDLLVVSDLTAVSGVLPERDSADLRARAFALKPFALDAEGGV